MIIGYLVVGIFLGLMSLAVVLLLGAPLWVGLLTYVAVGSGSVAVLAALRLVATMRHDTQRTQSEGAQ